MRLPLAILTLLAPAGGPAAAPPTWRPVPVPAATRGLLERQENGAFVLTDARGRPQALCVACKKGGHSVNVAQPLRSQP